MKKAILSLIILCTGISYACAEATDISKYDDVVYVTNTEASPNSQVTLSVNMKNSFETPGFQFDLVLPEGFSVAKDADEMYMIALSTERTTAKKTNYFDGALQADGSFRILCNTSAKDASTGKLYVFSGNDGEVCTITLNVASTVAYGNYEIGLKNIEISDLNSVGHAISDEIKSVITVKDNTPVYDTGYSISVTPFTAKTSTAYTIPLNFNAKEENITDIEFDMELPSFFTRTKSGRVTKVFDSADENRMYVSGTEGDHSVTVNGNHVTIAAIATDEYKYIAGTSGALLNMYYTSGSSIDAGIYPINFTNIQLKNGDGTVLNLAPATSYVKVGTPADASLTINGHVTEDVNTSLASETSITSLDMGDVTSIDGTLTLVDGRNFVAPKKAVDVDKVEYTRNMTYEWGTICMPFALTSDATIQYYQLKNVSSIAMTFEPVSNVSANLPVVFKLLSGNSASIAAENTSIVAGSKEWDGTLSGKSWTMNGTMTAINLDPTTVENDIYYIADNKFWHANQSFDVPAFCGWFETDKTTSLAKMYDIATWEDTPTGINYVEKADGTVDVIFDITGRKLSGTMSGINIINGKKILVK